MRTAILILLALNLVAAIVVGRFIAQHAGEIEGRLDSLKVRYVECRRV